MSIEIPTDLQPAIAAAVASGEYQNEQELVIAILRAAVPMLGQYKQLRSEIQASLEDLEQGRVRDADFIAVREQLRGEYDASGKRR
jgi:Arc/MetJ-type ribon-helix-helix transcriptional regulator